MASVVETKIHDFFVAGRTQRFVKSEGIYFAGDTVDKVYFISNGRIGQYNISKTGQKTVLNVFKKGAFIPLPYVIRDVPTPHFFEALTDCTVLVRSAHDTRQFLDKNSDVVMSVLIRVYNGVDGLQQRMLLMAGGDAHARVALELQIIASRFGDVNADGKTIIPVTETELAATAGLSRETVSREIGKLKQAGIVGVVQNKLAIYDIDALMAIVRES